MRTNPLPDWRGSQIATLAFMQFFLIQKDNSNPFLILALLPFKRKPGFPGLQIFIKGRGQTPLL
jgi:hypothetical protein